ncbi:hypothetical protein BDW75DRAFT_14809 [Aspergillus navahoensis]
MLIGGERSAYFPGVDREGDEEEEGRILVKLRLDRTRTPSKRLSVARNGTFWGAIGVCVRYARCRLKRDKDSGAQGIAQGNALVDYTLNKKLTVYTPEYSHLSQQGRIAISPRPASGGGRSRRRRGRGNPSSWNLEEGLGSCLTPKTGGSWRMRMVIGPVLVQNAE